MPYGKQSSDAYPDLAAGGPGDRVHAGADPPRDRGRPGGAAPAAGRRHGGRRRSSQRTSCSSVSPWACACAVSRSPTCGCARARSMPGAWGCWRAAGPIARRSPTGPSSAAGMRGRRHRGDGGEHAGIGHRRAALADQHAGWPFGSRTSAPTSTASPMHPRRIDCASTGVLEQQLIAGVRAGAG